MGGLLGCVAYQWESSVPYCHSFSQICLELEHAHCMLFQCSGFHLRGANFKGQWAVSRDIFAITSGGNGCCWHLVGELENTAKTSCKMYRTAPTREN